MMQEFARAKARFERLPVGSRPVITTAATVTRRDELAARRRTG